MTFPLHLHISTLSAVTLLTISGSFFNSRDKWIISESKTLLLIIEALSVAKHFEVIIIVGLDGESRIYQAGILMFLSICRIRG